MVDLNHPDEFKFWKFPAGEIGCRHLRSTSPKVISARLTNSEELIKLCLAVDAIKNKPLEIPKHLNINYMPYARQDKVHEFGDSFSLRVIVGIIDNLGFESVGILDPHSDVAANLFTKTRVIVHNGSSHFRSYVKSWDHKKTIMVVPDVGARKRCEQWANVTDITQLVQVFKKRDPATGKITKLEIPGCPIDSYWQQYDRFIIADDICDGGGTFIGIAKELESLGIKNLREKLYLYTTHGVYSNDAVSRLREYFAGLGCTNSFQEFDLRWQENNNLFAVNCW